MGLDIYHAVAKQEAAGRFFRVDGISRMKPLQTYFQPHSNPHFDWPKMFADRGLIYQNLRIGVRATDGKNTCFVFVDGAAEGMGEARAIFSDEWRPPLVPRFLLPSKFRFPRAGKAPHFFGPFATVMKTETVVFYDLAGYQRNSVSDEFYQRFLPDDVTCDRNRAVELHRMTAIEAQDEFKRNFLDNWVDDRSFIIVSY